MEKNQKYKLIDLLFYWGLAIKGAIALLEIGSGFMLTLVSHDHLNQLLRLITTRELQKNPNDFIMNYLLTLGQNFSISSQHFASLFMLLHGMIKITVVFLLLRKILWAYPLSVFVFSLLITYEIYSYMNTSSILLMLLILLDAAMIIIILLEYKRLKSIQSTLR